MAMTLVELQAFIDSKPDTRNIVNEIADYLQANPGGGGLTLYSGDAPLASDRTVDLNGKTLEFEQGVNYFLLIDPTAGSEVSSLAAFNTTGGGNQALLTVETGNTSADFELATAFNAAAKEAKIFGVADATTATIGYTADTHTFNGTIEYNGDGKLLADRTVDLNGKILNFDEGGNNFLALNPTVNSEEIILTAANVTGSGNSGGYSGNATNLVASFQAQAGFNGGAKIAKIQGDADATTSTLTYDADTHSFSSVVAADFANDAAAAAGGIPVGGLYNTSGTVKIRLI